MTNICNTDIILLRVRKDDYFAGGFKMKKGIVIAIVVAILLSLYSACSPKTVTYYHDANGNGREDWGEAVWYEDDKGVHPID